MTKLAMFLCTLALVFLHGAADEVVSAKVEREEAFNPSFDPSIDIFSYFPKDVLISDFQESDPDEILDNSTETGFIKEIDGQLTKIKQESCSAVKCTSSKYLGCACSNWFLNTAKQCPDLPCKAINLVIDRAPTLVRKLPLIKDFEDIAQLVLDTVLIPTMELLCSCREDVFDGVVYCLREYDGDILAEDSDPQAGFMWRTMMKSVDLESIKNVGMRLLEKICTKAGGDELCYRRTGEILITGAQMLDNSFKGDTTNICKSYNRLSGVIEKYVLTFDKLTNSKEDPVTFAETLAAAQKEILKKFYCDKKCAKFISKRFYGCCAKELASVFDKKMLKDIISFIKSLQGLFDDGEIIKFDFTKQTKRDILQMADPLKMCPKVPFYRKMSRVC